MDGLADLVAELVVETGVPESAVFRREHLELPGFFRPTNKWDLLVIVDDDVIAAVDFKAQVGPSFGNNYNSRTEKALGNATDLLTAYRAGAFRTSPKPWLGYLILLENDPRSTRTLTVQEPHFPVLDEFRGASYAQRYALLCRKLLRHRIYDGACFLLSGPEEGIRGEYQEPEPELSFRSFVAGLTGHMTGYLRLTDG